jgi:hypothetical protein
MNGLRKLFYIQIGITTGKTIWVVGISAEEIASDLLLTGRELISPQI